MKAHDPLADFERRLKMTILADAAAVPKLRDRALRIAEEEGLPVPFAPADQPNRLSAWGS